MSKISEHILPFLKDDEIEYSLFNHGKRTMSLRSFEANFKLIAFSELPEINKYSYYYQNLKEPDLLMYIRVKHSGYAAMLAKYTDADECFHHLKIKLGFTINKHNTDTNEVQA